MGATLTGRKTPRLPPPRQSTPKHTSIGGSPKRQGSARPASRHAPSEGSASSPNAQTQPPANRRLDFVTTNRDRKSLKFAEAQSPFKPSKTLRRSTGPARPSIYDHPEDDEDDEPGQTTNGVVGDDEDVEPSIEDNEPLMVDDGDAYPLDFEQTEPEPESEIPVKRKRGRPRKSDQSNASQLDNSIASSSRVKRSRTSLDDSQLAEGDPEQSSRLSKKKRFSNANSVIIHRDGEDETMDPSLIAHGDEYIANIDDEDGVQPDPDLEAQLNSQLDIQADAAPNKKGRGRPKGKKAAVPKERDANRAMKQKSSPVKLNESPSKLRGRGGSAGPVSNVNLRATTPFADAESQSRFGRNLIQPLKYWANEGRIWKAGEIEGIIRAEPVEQVKFKTKRRKKSKKRNARLQSVDEESETESTIPDEWEEEMGVITGNVANWNPEAKAGDPDNPIQEGMYPCETLNRKCELDTLTPHTDLAFAASSIITRDVAGSDFKYAKIMTIPFFGAGVVELPPEGFKRAKNSRKMQMVFFVHEGKVMVEVGATGLEVNQFAISKGGVWIVPRGKPVVFFPITCFRIALLPWLHGTSPHPSPENVWLRIGFASGVQDRSPINRHGSAPLIMTIVFGCSSSLGWR